MRVYTVSLATIFFFPSMLSVAGCKLHCESVFALHDVHFIGNALDEDVGRLNLASLDPEQEAEIDLNSLCSPLSSSLSGPTTAGM